MNILTEPMTFAHHDDVMALWKKAETIGLSGADGQEKVKVYLARNPGMSFVAKKNGVIEGWESFLGKNRLDTENRYPSGFQGVIGPNLAERMGENGLPSDALLTLPSSGFLK
jgi:hypothetical protein